MTGISIVSDTNPLIYLLSGNKDVADYLEGKHVWISVITELELFGKKHLNNKDLQIINNLVTNCFIADINPEIKQLTKNLMQNYSVKLPDAIIAATSLYLDLPLLSADAVFKNISELKFILLEI